LRGEKGKEKQGTKRLPYNIIFPAFLLIARRRSQEKLRKRQ
jgi:hypothetical protein